MRDGITHEYCNLLPKFSEEFDSPVLGKLPNGEWLQFTPTINLVNNGPAINDELGPASTLKDGGGQTYVETGEKVKCANVPRSIFNEETCFLSTESTACSASSTVGEVEIPMNASNIKHFYDLSERYIYAIKGLVNEELDQHPCVTETS